MRKRDLVHLHALLALVRDRLAERGDPPDGAYDAYEALEVPPTGINHRKSEHERAVAALLDGIEATIAARERTAGPPSDASRESQSNVGR
ncbi:MAG: UPF0058 family protein [Haloarculaceae archaeon]